jgi:hypothetical protein
MHDLSSVYSVTIPLHVSGLLVTHHQEVTVYICNSWYVVYILVDCQQTWLVSAVDHLVRTVMNSVQLVLKVLADIFYRDSVKLQKP